MAAPLTNRRLLLNEAVVLLRYLGVTRPALVQMRAYARAVGPSATPLRLPAFVHRWPAALRLFDPVQRSSPLAARLDIACLLLDVSLEGRRLAYAYEPRNRIRVWLALAGTVAFEGVMLGARWVAGRVWRA